MKKSDWFVNVRFGLFLHWGFELLRADEQRIPPKDVKAGNVPKIVLKRGV